MDGIEKITSRIEQDMRAEIAAIEAEEARQVEEIRQKYSEQARREREAILVRGREAAAERGRRLAGAAALESKKQLLAAKQEMLAQAFALAAEKLRQLPENQQVEFLAALAASAAANGQGQIILSPRDRAAYGEAVVAEANKRLNKGRLTLADNPREINGGLLLLQGDVEINCSIDTLLSLLRESLSPEVAQILFAAEE